MSYITIGKITSIWVILNNIIKYPDISEKDLITICLKSTLKGGSLPILESYKLATSSSIIKLNEKYEIHNIIRKSLTREISHFSTQNTYRDLLLIILIYLKPPWITFIFGDLNEILFAMPWDWKESIIYLELDNLEDQNVLIWWKKIKRSLTFFENRLLKKIGDIGESLTEKHEKRRLNKDNQYKLANNVKIISKVSDLFHYDVLSFTSKSWPISPLEKGELYIEVKSSTSKLEDSFSFYLTSSEWKKAEENSNRYFFYFWCDINIPKIDESIQGDGPYVFSTKFINNYIPKNISEKGIWQKCRITLTKNVMFDKCVYHHEIV